MNNQLSRQLHKIWVYWSRENVFKSNPKAEHFKSNLWNLCRFSFISKSCLTWHCIFYCGNKSKRYSVGRFPFEETIPFGQRSFRKTVHWGNAHLIELNSHISSVGQRPLGENYSFEQRSLDNLNNHLNYVHWKNPTTTQTVSNIVVFIGATRTSTQS